MTSASITVGASTRPNVGAILLAAVGTAALAAIVGIGLRIATAATTSAAFLVPSGRRTGYPAWMRGPLHAYGKSLTLHGFLVLMTLMLVAWGVALICARALPFWLVAAAALFGVLTFTLAPPLLSTDVFNYIAYGQMGVNGIDPYAYGPVMLAGQPIYGYTGHLWKNVPSAYGPLFTLLSYALTPLGVAGAFWAFKALAGAACVATAGFACLAARRLGRSPTFALILIALNPLVLVYAVGGAHNDLLTAAFLAAAVYLAVSARAASAGAVAVAAVAIKASAGLALPFILLGARPRRRALAGMLGAGVVATGASLLIFGPTIAKMLDALALQQRFNWIVVSMPSFVTYYLGLGHPSHLARQLLTAGTAAVIVALIARARGGRGWIEGAAAATLVLLATTAWVLPWYIVWALPFAALVRQRTVPVAAVGLTAVLLAMQLDHFVLTHASHHRHPTARSVRHERNGVAGLERRRAHADQGSGWSHPSPPSASPQIAQSAREPAPSS
jgi:alpha-1,6-mannosyltransferase